MRPITPLLALALAIPANARPEGSPAAASPPVRACGESKEAAALRQALADVTREVIELRQAMGGPFDGVNGLRREVEGLRSEIADLRRAVEALRR